MARLYSNENFPEPAVKALRALGHDVLSTREAGLANRAIPDEDVLAYSTAEERIVVTYNRRDFIQLHAKSSAHAGIIVCSVDRDTEALAQRIHQALLADGSDQRGRLLRVERKSGHGIPE
jgi:predicted nuclease of predicted toxin-antitoxin system